MSTPLDDRIPLRTPREILQRPTRDVIVEENQTLQFSPENVDMAVHFSRTLLQRFEDLQHLGLVPRNLAEEKVREAIDEDNREAYKLAGALITSTSHGTCHCAHSQRTSKLSADFRRAYREVRQAHAPAMARLLSDHYQAAIPFDDPQPRIMTRWVLHLRDAVSPYRPIVIAALKDITIKRGATMHVAQPVKSLNANDIWIHREGALRQEGGHLRIWANRIMAYLDLAELLYEPVAHAPWILQQA